MAICYSCGMSAPPTSLDPSTTALFLDVDGTLVELQDHPQSVTVESALLDSLRGTSRRLDSALALVSGRALADLDRMFAPETFAAAGAHGTQLRLADDTHHDPSTPALPAAVAERVQQFVAQHEGLLLEHKAAGLSLHYRKAPELEACARALVENIVRDLGDAFRIIDGKMVLEIAPSSHSKGAAIRHFLEHAPFRGRAPVFIGDDVTDEDGFVAINDLDGIAIRVGDLNGSQAKYNLPDVHAVRRWIDTAFS